MREIQKNLRVRKCLKTKENLHKEKKIFGLTSRSSDYAQALMELGALICKPSIPLCNHCPLTKNCKAFNRKDFSGLTISTLNSSLIMLHLLPSSLLFQLPLRLYQPCRKQLLVSDHTRPYK